MLDELKRLDNETEEDYKIRVCSLKEELGMVWDEIRDVLNSELNESYSESYYRKWFSAYLRGRKDAIDDKVSSEEETEYYSPSDEDTIIRDRYKTQTENIPYFRLLRQDTRFERFYSKIAEAITKLEPPQVILRPSDFKSNKKEYIATVADLHIGAKFDSVNNSYSIEEAIIRFEKAYQLLSRFIDGHRLDKIKILSLGDIVQGILRISDLKLNEQPVVDSFITAMKLMAKFLNRLSSHCKVEFIQVCYSNHDQIRPLGTKASELATEDLGKIFFNYLKDVLADNDRVTVSGDLNNDYTEFKIFDFNCIALHGHQIKSVSTVVSDLTNRHRKFFDYVFLGHTHSAKEFIAAEGKNHNIEVLISSSFCGSDQYADSLMVGSKASVKVFGFDEKYGHIESYNFMLN